MRCHLLKTSAEVLKAKRIGTLFLSVTKQGHSAIFQTAGNPDCHVILRGGTNGTNFDSVSIANTQQSLEAAGVEAGIMVDMSHANSSKDHNKQMLVCDSLSHQIEEGNHQIVGVMVESNIEAGRQDINSDKSKLTYGQSITDACIGWDDTEHVIEKLSAAVAARRAASSK